MNKRCNRCHRQKKCTQWTADGVPYHLCSYCWTDFAVKMLALKFIPSAQLERYIAK